MALRSYCVLSKEDVQKLGGSVFSPGDFNRFAMVATKDGILDNIVAWGFRKEPLEIIAAKRNDDMNKLRRSMNVAVSVIEVKDEPVLPAV